MSSSEMVVLMAGTGGDGARIARRVEKTWGEMSMGGVWRVPETREDQEEVQV